MVRNLKISGNVKNFKKIENIFYLRVNLKLKHKIMIFKTKVIIQVIISSLKGFHKGNLGEIGIEKKIY